MTWETCGKRKGRRSWDGGPSGLLLLQTPGLAERKVGRPYKLLCRISAYHFTVKLRTDMSWLLRSSFFAGSAFLFFFTGFAVGFMMFIPLVHLGLTCPAVTTAIATPKGIPRPFH
jgi:hypothetical protein